MILVVTVTDIERVLALSLSLSLSWKRRTEMVMIDAYFYANELSWTIYGIARMPRATHPEVLTWSDHKIWVSYQSCPWFTRTSIQADLPTRIPKKDWTQNLNVHVVGHNVGTRRWHIHRWDTRTRSLEISGCNRWYKHTKNTKIYLCEYKYIYIRYIKV